MPLNYRLIVPACAGLSLALACATTPEPKAEVPPPEVVSQDLNVDQDIGTFTLGLEGTLKSEAPATVEKATWEMVVDGKVVKSGEQPLDVQVPAGGTAPFSVQAQSRYVSSPEELKAMSEKGGSLLAALRGKLHVKQDGATREVEFARGREVRTPRLPAVKMHTLDAARFSDKEANILYSLGVVNPNPFPLGVERLTYKVEVGGKQVAEGERAVGDKITPASTGVYDVQVAVDEANIGPEIKALIKSQLLPWVITGELKGDLYVIPYKLDGAVRLNVSK